MLPEEWRSGYLGDLFSFKNGLNGEKSLYGTGTKFVNVMDVFRGPRLRNSEIIGEMEVSKKQLNEFNVQYGDVLFNRTSETDDEIALSTVYLDDTAAVFGGFIIRARPNGKLIIPDFCVYVFQSASIRREMIRRGQGAIRSNIGQGDLATVPIRLPPPSEQQKIAEILSTWDQAIAVQERLIANARAQKKALMQTLLTKQKRLPGFSGSWIETTICGVAKIEWGNTSLTKAAYVDHGFPAFSASGQDGYVKTAQWFGEGIVLSAIGARCGRCFWADGSWTAIKNTIVVQSKPNISDPKFLFLILNDPDFWPISGGAQPFIGLQNARRTKILMPPFEEQSELARVFLNASRRIDILKEQLKMLKNEKSALMQQLLTGKRRVKVGAVAA